MVKENELLPSNTKGLIILGVIVTLFMITLFSTCYIIQAGERGILLTFGKVDTQVRGEGLGFKIPFIQKIVKMGVKTMKSEVEIYAGSRDLQTIYGNITVNYRLKESYAPTMYKEVGVNYVSVILEPAVLEISKQTISMYNAEEILTKRSDVKDKMKDLLYTRMLDKGIIIDDVLITNFDYSESFNKAIENKVTAEQNALAAKNKLEQIKYEAEQTVTIAKAQADSLKLLQQSATKETIELQRLKVQQSAIDKWDGKLPQVTGGAIPFISLTGNYTN
jgi:regulator of protease activity HflC (stomatin/prohibitin superfamily)